jgi:hypothetical protein
VLDREVGGTRREEAAGRERERSGGEAGEVEGGSEWVVDTYRLLELEIPGDSAEELRALGVWSALPEFLIIHDKISRRRSCALVLP